jgi:hypothetical protein
VISVFIVLSVALLDTHRNQMRLCFDSLLSRLLLVVRVFGELSSRLSAALPLQTSSLLFVFFETETRPAHVLTLSVSFVQQEMALDDAKLRKYKTVMCQRILRNGSCRFGALCDFAHDAENDLRRNLNQFFYAGVRCDKENCSAGKVQTWAL